MNILLTGYDGYEGFPLAIKLLKEGHCVIGIDDQNRRAWVKAVGSQSAIPIESIEKRGAQLVKLGNFINYNFSIIDHVKLDSVFKKHHIDVVIHLASQPSAPFSMKEKEITNIINIDPTIRLAENLSYYNPKGQFIFVSTMGEYGTPKFRIEQGFYSNGAPFSRDPGSWYHLSKVIATQALYLHHKLTDLKIHVIMQGVVYGTRTEAMEKEHTTRFDFDKYFGTVLNRFVAQTLINKPMTVYGRGKQQRGLLDLDEAIEGIWNVMNDSLEGFRVSNHISFIKTIDDIALAVKEAGSNYLGLHPSIIHIKNPRKELDYHQYDVDFNRYSLSDFFNESINKMFEELQPFENDILECVDSM